MFNIKDDDLVLNERGLLVNDPTVNNKNALTKYYGYVMKYSVLKELANDKDFNKLPNYKKESIFYDAIRENSRELRTEIKRLLRINGAFVYTEYFNKLAGLLNLYFILSSV